MVVEHASRKYGVRERQACRMLKQWRGTQRYLPMHRTDEDALTRNIIALASEYGHYGYRRITALSQARDWQVGKDRVQRTNRRTGVFWSCAPMPCKATPPKPRPHIKISSRFGKTPTLTFLSLSLATRNTRSCNSFGAQNCDARVTQNLPTLPKLTSLTLNGD